MIYLNNAATSYPKPGRVVRAVSLALTSPPTEAARSSGSESDPFSLCRVKVAAFFGAAGPDEVILTPGATSALNLVLNGLDYSRRRKVITSLAEHNAVLRPLYELRRRGTIDLHFVDCESDGWVDPSSLDKAVDEKTAALIITEASNVTGVIQDLGAASEIALRSGSRLIVDGAQGAGFSFIDLSRLAVDAYIFAGHKYLFGIEGMGGLILRRGFEVRPLLRGGTGYESMLEDQPERRPDRYEAGTGNRVGAAALLAGIEFLNELGRSEIIRRTAGFRNIEEERLAGLPRIRSIKRIQRNGPPRIPLMSFAVEGFSVKETAYCLEHSFGIRVRYGLHCAPLINSRLGVSAEGTVRASPSILTDLSEWEALFDAIKAMGS